MAAVEMAVEAPSSVELLHVPKQITGRIRLATLIKTSLLTEFPVNRLSPEARQLSPDEARDLLTSPGSPWERHAWWSEDVRPLLEQAVSGEHRVSHRYLLSRLQTLSLPRQNLASLGEQMTALSHLTSCSLACNALTEVHGWELPRTLRSLQLYGNRLADTLTDLLTGCPPLQYLGLGRVQLTDNHLSELTSLLSAGLPSLRVLDLCDNHIRDVTGVTDLVTAADNIRAIDLSGNPAFLASGYYQHFLTGAARLKLLDGVELTNALLDDLQQQLRPAEEPDDSASKKKKSGKKSTARKGSRRPSMELDLARFEPSLSSALVRITGAIYLPFVPKDQWPGQELCVVFHWSGERQCPAAFSSPTPPQAGDTSSDSGGADGLCPLESLLQEKSDVTALEVPLEWHCGDLTALRDAMLEYLRVEVVRREKWTPPKKSKKEKGKDTKKETEKEKKKENDEKEAKGGKKKKSGEADTNPKQKDSNIKGGSATKKSAEADAESPADQPPPEFSLGSLLLPVRPLLRPGGTLLLQGTTSSSGTATAAVTEISWMDAILNIQEEKKERKASVKKAEKEEKAKNKRMSASVRSGSSRKKDKAPDPVIRCFFSVELYRKPLPEPCQQIVLLPSLKC